MHMHLSLAEIKPLNSGPGNRCLSYALIVAEALRLFTSSIDFSVNLCYYGLYHFNFGLMPFNDIIDRPIHVCEVIHLPFGINNGGNFRNSTNYEINAD